MSTAPATVVETQPKAGESTVEKPRGEVKSKVESGDISGVYRIAQNEVDDELARGLGLSKIDDPNAGTIAGPEIVALKQADADFENKAKTALGGLKTSIDSVAKPAETEAEKDARLNAVAEKAMAEGPLTEKELVKEINAFHEEKAKPVVVEKTPEGKQLEVLDADIKRGVDEFEREESQKYHVPGSPEADEVAGFLASEEAFEKRRASIARQKLNLAKEQKIVQQLEAEPSLSPSKKAYLESAKASSFAIQSDLDLMNAVEGIALAKKAGDTKAQALYEAQIPLLHQKHEKAYELSMQGFRNSAYADGVGAEYDAREKKHMAESKLAQELPVPRPDAPTVRKEETEQGEVTVTELKGVEADQTKDEILAAEVAPETFARLEVVRKELAAEQLALHEFEKSHGKAHTPIEQAYLDALNTRITALEFEKTSHETTDESFEAKAKQAELKQKADKAEAAYQKMYDALSTPAAEAPKAVEQPAAAGTGALHLEDEDLDYEAHQYEQFHPGQTFGAERPTVPAGKTGIGVSPMEAPPKPKGRMGKFVDSLKFWNYLSGKQQ